MRAFWGWGGSSSSSLFFGNRPFVSSLQVDWGKLSEENGVALPPLHCSLHHLKNLLETSFVSTLQVDGGEHSKDEAASSEAFRFRGFLLGLYNPIVSKRALLSCFVVGPPVKHTGSM